jgi:hypothetical protein
MKVINFPLKRAILDAQVISDFEPWQTVTRAWSQGDGNSVYAVGVPILREWLKVHPGDSHVRERLADWESRLNDREPVNA